MFSVLALSFILRPVVTVILAPTPTPLLLRGQNLQRSGGAGAAGAESARNHSAFTRQDVSELRDEVALCAVSALAGLEGCG